MEKDIRHISYFLKAGEQALGGRIRLELKEETNARRGYSPPSDLGVESIVDKFSNYVDGSPCALCTSTAGSCAVRTGLHERKERKKKKKAHLGTSEPCG